MSLVSRWLGSSVRGAVTARDATQRPDVASQAFQDTGPQHHRTTRRAMRGVHGTARHTHSSRGAHPVSGSSSPAHVQLYYYVLPLRIGNRPCAWFMQCTAETGAERYVFAFSFGGGFSFYDLRYVILQALRVISCLR